MPCEYDVAPDPPIAWLRCTGMIDLSSFSVAVHELTRDPQLGSHVAVLCDGRQAENVPEPWEVWDVANVLRLFGQRRRVALVVRQGLAFYVAKQVSRMTGSPMQVFVDFLAAVRWLSEADAETVS